MLRSTFAGGLILACLTFGCADDAPGEGSGGSGGSSSPSGPGATTSTMGQGGGGSTTGTTGSGGTNCNAAPACDTPLPSFGAPRGFIHTSSSITASTGFANHRGRDMFYNPGDALWVMGKFAYGVADDDIKDEDIDIYLLRDCGSTWEYLQTVRTTDDGEHPTVEGVVDTGGWMYYQVPPGLNLGPGRHRFQLVVGGDLSHTEVYIDIVEPGTPIVVTDVDGTLTVSENEEFSALLTGATPGANSSSPDVMWALANKGYRIFYLTARPQFLAGRTRDFINERQYPPGLLHTTLSFTGATGAEAAAYKTVELYALADRGLKPDWAFGNKDSDAEAFTNIGVSPLSQCVLYQYTDATYGCRRIDDYVELLPEINASPFVQCP